MGSMNGRVVGPMTAILLCMAAVVGLADVAGNQTEIWRFVPMGGSEGVQLQRIDDVTTDVSTGRERAQDEVVDSAAASPVVSLSTDASEVFTGELIHLNAEGSYDPDGMIASYHWDLHGSGAFPLVTSGPMLPFVYLDDGVFDVRLRVEDNEGNGTISGLLPIAVFNRPPTAALSASCSVVETGTTLSFDASSSADEDGEIIRFTWDLDGDGVYEQETASATVTHSYSDDGQYHVGVLIVDDDGAEAAAETTITVNNRAPTAAFRALPEGVTDAEEATFVGTGSDRDGTIARWSWHFGDGGAAAAETATHRYTDAGSYDVTLEVWDDDGEKSAIVAAEVTISNALPEAVLRLSATTVAVGETVWLTDLSRDPSATGQVIHMGLDFGDGASTTGGAVYGAQYAHSYAAPGEYEVSLYAVDNDGGMDSTMITVTVQ